MCLTIRNLDDQRISLQRSCSHPWPVDGRRALSRTDKDLDALMQTDKLLPR